MRLPLALCLAAAAAAAMAGCTTPAGTGGDATAADGAVCINPDPEKLPPTSGRSRRIFYGDDAPEICLGPRQQLAIGAITMAWRGWTNGCTGTLVADGVVLTAGHCMTDQLGNVGRPIDYRFVVGDNAVLPAGSFNVRSIQLHPRFSIASPDHDVAVVLLEDNPVAGQLGILPLPLGGERELDHLLGQWVQTVGFGATETNPDNAQRHWTMEEITRVDRTVIEVYGQGESSVCFGDSGGPALLAAGGRYLSVLATASRGDTTCVDYDLFTRADDNRRFIESVAGAIDPCAGIDSAGNCDGNVALWCERGRLRVDCCAVGGRRCGDDGAGNQRCLEDPCGGVDFLGACSGETAIWCQDGERRRRRCDLCGQTCGWTGADLGNYCRP